MTPPPANLCGPCRLCCILPPIAALAKPPDTPCRHLVEAGCGIYLNRPEACRGFRCLWLSERLAGRRLADRYRPDRCSVVFYSAPTLDGRPAAVGLEATSGAADASLAAVELICRLQQAGYPVAVHYLPPDAPANGETTLPIRPPIA